jgi:hypothetical protein
LPSPYPYPCRLRAFYPLPVGVRRVKNPRIAKSALTPLILGFWPSTLSFLLRSYAVGWRT